LNILFYFVLFSYFIIFITLIENLNTLEHQSETLRKTIGDEFEHISATKIIGIPKIQKIVAGGN